MSASANPFLGNRHPFQFVPYTPWMKEPIEVIERSSFDDVLHADIWVQALYEGWPFKVLLKQGEVVGYYIGRPNPTDIDEFELVRLAVTASERKKGYGSGLLNNAIDAAKLVSCKKISLRVPEDMTDEREPWRFILPWLKSNKLRAEKRLPGKYQRDGKDIDIYVFEKRLDTGQG